MKISHWATDGGHGGVGPKDHVQRAPQDLRRAVGRRHQGIINHNNGIHDL